MISSFEIRGSLLAYNTALNLAGQLVPLLVGAVSIPFIIHGLGTDGFGVLSVALVVLGYFSLFDLGLARATTKYVAEHLGRGDERLFPSLVWTSVLLNVVLGVAAAILLGALTPLLVDSVFNIPPELLGEARSTFFYLALSLPLVLVGAVFRGVLEAGQRFDLVNAVKAPASVLTFLIPAGALPFGFRLPEIMLLLVIARLGTVFAYLALCRRAFPVLVQAVSFDLTVVRSLFTYGGWVTVSSMLGTILVYLDKILIGSLISVAAVAYYILPYEVVTRLWIFPGSLVTSLFPAFTALREKGSFIHLDRLYAQSVRQLLLAMGPLVLVLIFFAKEILHLWLGTDFAERSTLVFQILAVGVLANSLAWVPFSLLQAIGRPDLTAKIHLVETPIYILLAWFLIKQVGITGAALAWVLRMGLEAFLLFGACWWLRRVSLRAFLQDGLLRSIMLLGTLGAGMFLVGFSGGTMLVRLPATIGLNLLFYIAVWFYVLQPRERSTLLSAGKLLLALPHCRQ